MMGSFKGSRILSFFLRIWIGFIFAYAGYSKLMEPVENFRGMLAEYRVIPYAWLPLVSMTVPWIEFISGVFMILGLAIPLTAVLQAWMCFCFLTVIGSSSMLLESAGKECGCFGQSGPIRLTVWQVFILDFINFIIAIKLWREKTSTFSLDSFLGTSNKSKPA